MSPASKDTLIILCLCDFQSRLLPFMLPVSLGVSDDLPMGGLARVAGIVKQQRTAYPDNLFVAALGADPTGPLYRYLGGRAEYESLYQAGFDALVPGEHEVELGREHFEQSFDYIQTPLLCANLRPTNRCPGVWADHMVLELQALKVGFFGLSAFPMSACLPEGSCLEKTGDIMETAHQQVEQLRQRGCRLIIALTHIGLENDKELARHVAGLHAVLGAGSHTPTPEPVWIRSPAGRSVPVVQALGGGAALGRLELLLDRSRPDDPQYRWEQILMDENVVEDPEADALAQRFHQQLQEILDRPVAELTRPLPADRKDLLNGRTSLGYLLADGIRRAGQSHVGLIGAPDITAGAGLAAGPVGRSDLYRLMPFGNPIWEVELSGRELLEIMTGALSACSFSLESPKGPEDLWERSFLYFSGLKIQDSRPIRLWVAEQGDWKPLKDQRTYRVAAPLLLRQGGRGCRAIARAPGFNLGIQEVEAVASLLEETSRFTGPDYRKRLLKE